MNKTEFINSIAEKSGLSKVDAKKALNAFVDTIASELKKNDKVSILGFGTFGVSKKAARTGLNPRTKESIVIPEHNVAKFKPSKELNNTLN